MGRKESNQTNKTNGAICLVTQLGNTKGAIFMGKTAKRFYMDIYSTF